MTNCFLSWIDLNMLSRLITTVLVPFSNGGTFRFDITVTGEGNAHASISLIVIPGSDWDRPTIRAATAGNEAP